MKEHTDEEIASKLRELWPEQSHCDTTYKVERGPSHIDITVQQMYDSPGLSFAKLSSLAEFFDTMNVETESEFHEGGCETCDYGSAVGFTLRVRSGGPYRPLTV